MVRWQRADVERFWCAKMMWINHEDEEAEIGMPLTEADTAPYSREPGMPGGKGAYAGPHDGAGEHRGQRTRPLLVFR